MPRAEQSAAGKIVGFFRTASLENAELVLGLCQDEVRSRKQRSADAKQRQRASTASGEGATNGSGKPAAVASGAKKAKGAKKGAKKGPKPAPASPTPLADQSLPGLSGPAEEVGEGAEIIGGGAV